MLAAAIFVASTAAVAETAIDCGALVSVLGAVYSPCCVIVPTVELPPDTPATAQATFVFELPVTVAVNCCDLPGNKSTFAGDTLMLTPETITKETLASSPLLAFEIAVTVTSEGLGTVAGGVYKPLVLIVPTVGFPPS